MTPTVESGFPLRNQEVGGSIPPWSTNLAELEVHGATAGPHQHGARTMEQQGLTIADSLVILAVLLAPLIAVNVQRAIDYARER